MQEDTYNTIAQPSEGVYKEKGSKFFAYAYPVYSEEEIKGHIDDLKKEFYDARHHCYAWRLGANLKRFRANDDGEPSNTAGKPILGQIQSKELTNILIVVVRYFGGTKLGVGGLITAYRSAALDTIKNAEVVSKTVNDFYEITFSYAAMNNVMTIIKNENLNQINPKFELTCSLTLCIRQNDSKRIVDSLVKVDSVEAELIRTA